MTEQSPATRPGRETGDDGTPHEGGISLAAALGGTLLSIGAAVPPSTTAGQGTGHRPGRPERTTR